VRVPSRGRLILGAAVIAVALLSVVVITIPRPSNSAVEVSVDRSRTAMTSQLDLGFTYGRDSLDPQTQAANIAAPAMLPTGIRYHNQHLMGFGADNPEPSPGKYNWGSLDERMQRIRSMGGTPVLTLCCAPTWMVDPQWRGGTDWTKLELAPLPAHVRDFADLAARAAARYPYVQDFQVWNEFKGMWDEPANTWDYVRYTDLYNHVYDALKRVNPAVRVGGPYLPVEGTGTGGGDWWSGKPVSQRNRQVLEYWLANSHGADFMALDRALVDDHDPNTYTVPQYLSLTREFGRIMDQARALTALPIWWSELYVLDSREPAVQAVGTASILYQVLTHGSAVAMLWDPEVQPDPSSRAGGAPRSPARKGQVTEAAAAAAYGVYQSFQLDFGRGAPLYPTTSSNPKVLVLATTARTMLINQSASALEVRINGGRSIRLSAYGVETLPT
jgi:hypothetical protein